MDQTTHKLDHDAKTLDVRFDLINQENCTIDLSFTVNDIHTLYTMYQCGVYEGKILEGTSRACSRDRVPLRKQKIKFLYKNGNTGDGSVYYDSQKFKQIVTEAFEEIIKLKW